MSIHQLNMYGMDMVEVAIERLKAFEPVRHGHWILCRLNSLHLDWRNFECSVCRMNRIRRTGEVLNYCPNCGAKMDEKEQDHEL